MKNILLVGFGGAIGSVLRFLISSAIALKAFPAATFAINVVGSLLIGLVMGWTAKNEMLANNWKLFLGTGLCGGFTTFSSFSFENLLLLQQGKYLFTLAYVIGSFTLGIAAAFLGYKISNT